MAVKKEIINVMAQNCPAGKDDQYNKWYDVHIAENFKAKGVKKAIRYKRIGDDEKTPQYLAFYYFDNKEGFDSYNVSPERAAAGKVPGRPDGVTVSFRGQYELITFMEKK